MHLLGTIAGNLGRLEQNIHEYDQILEDGGLDPKKLVRCRDKHVLTMLNLRHDIKSPSRPGSSSRRSVREVLNEPGEDGEILIPSDAADGISWCSSSGLCGAQDPSRRNSFGENDQDPRVFPLAERGAYDYIRLSVTKDARLPQADFGQPPHVRVPRAGVGSLTACGVARARRDEYRMGTKTGTIGSEIRQQPDSNYRRQPPILPRELLSAQRPDPHSPVAGGLAAPAEAVAEDDNVIDRVKRKASLSNDIEPAYHHPLPGLSLGYTAFDSRHPVCRVGKLRFTKKTIFRPTEAVEEAFKRVACKEA